MKTAFLVSRVSAFVLIGAVCGALAACASSARRASALPSATLAESKVFPADRTLNRAEDGVALADGTLIVSDQVWGLRRVRPDGSSEPFGEMRSAGYLHDPPRRSAAANGVNMEPGGTHVLVADVFGGGIYRVAVAGGATERVYQHEFGVNTARRDSTGAIWFTQSTECTAESGEARMFSAVDIPAADGSLWRLGFRGGRFESRAAKMHGGLRFANGFVLNERRGSLYLSETCADRVLRFPLDAGAGRIGAPTVLAELPTPDNLELDDRGRLWVALPINNEVGVLDARTGAFRSVFRQQSPAQEEASAEFIRRGRESIPRMDLFTPDIWSPLPGPVTGVILGPGESDRFVSGLGDALVRLPE